VARDFPRFAKDLLQWHIRTNGDFLVRDNPRWFVAFVWCEVLVQLPFFFVAAYAYAAGECWVQYGGEGRCSVLCLRVDAADTRLD
jgi:hypothetical protein